MSKNYSVEASIYLFNSQGNMDFKQVYSLSID